MTWVQSWLKMSDVIYASIFSSTASNKVFISCYIFESSYITILASVNFFMIEYDKIHFYNIYRIWNTKNINVLWYDSIKVVRKAYVRFELISCSSVWCSQAILSLTYNTRSEIRYPGAWNSWGAQNRIQRYFITIGSCTILAEKCDRDFNRFKNRLMTNYFCLIWNSDHFSSQKIDLTVSNKRRYPYFRQVGEFGRIHDVYAS